MKHSIDRRSFLVATASGAAAAMAPLSEVHAQAGFPDKPIRLVVPFSAGGGTDILGRLLARSMAQSLGQQVVVDNVTGAGGVIGAQQVARAAKDGYTLMIGTPGSIQINPAMQPDIKYNVDKDFMPVSQFSDSATVLVVNKDSPWKTVQDLIAAAREKPGALNYGSAGIGSFAHFSAEMFLMLTGVKMTHVPYRGTAQAIADLRAGTLQVEFENLPGVLPLVKDNQLRALAVGSTRRSSFLPDLPTVIEAGVKGYESSSWTGLFAPVGLPAPVLARLEKAAADAARDPEVLKALRELGAEPVGSRSAEFAAFLARRRPAVIDTVAASGMGAK